jgi:uncharacterized repeat protein (TIGR01451 family)
MGRHTNHHRGARGRRALAFVVGSLLTVAFGLGQSATVLAAGSAGATRPDGTKPASANRTTDRSAPNALPSSGLTGGDVSLDYVAAGPGTYDHDTGVGGAYRDRTIDKNTGVVESLEGGDFACNDLVVFFTQVVIDSGASGSGTVQLDFRWNGNTTGQPGIGFVDLVSASANSPDSGNTANGNEAVSIVSESDSPNVTASIQITNLDPGEHFILRTVVRLGCQVGAHPTGNILTSITGASVVGDGRVSVGQQTVPLKKVEDVAQPGIQVQKTCPATGGVGDPITYSITVTNTGNEDLSNLVVNDPLLGGNLGKFPSTLAAGASDTETFTHTITQNDPDPLTNTVTATANGASSGATVSDQDSCSTDVLHTPGIRIQKTCPASGHIGDQITYSITVTNTGNERLDTLVVNDPLLGGSLGKFPSSLAVGASDTETFTYTITANDPDPLTNTVTATAVGADSGTRVTDTDSCDTDVAHTPGIDVEKTCPTGGNIGDQITYSITVTNTGDEALTGVVVNDPLLGGNLAGFPSSLAVGGSVTRTVTHTITADDPDPLTNTVTASGTGTDSGVSVEDTDSCGTDVHHQPGISVQKTCPRAAAIGDQITYSITVTNTGNERLDGLQVVDALLGGTLGSFPSSLAVGASVTKTFTHTVTADDPDPLTNTVTASGTGADSAQTVSDQDDCTTDITHTAGIDVEKTCPAGGNIGDQITYSITVTNTGDEALSGVVANDPLLGGNLAGFPSSLAVGASVTKTFTHTITPDDPDPLTNTVTASGTGADSQASVEDTDSCGTDVHHQPGISVQKTCPRAAAIGDTITYSITVTNTGNEALTGVVVVDELLGGALGSFPSTLAVGASVTKTFTHTITPDDPDPLTNTVTASGTGADSGQTVSDQDDCATDVTHTAGIDVSKTCPGAAEVGEAITYSITVTNTGNEALTGIVVNDPLLGGNLGSFASTLAVGASVTRTFTYTVQAGDPDPLTNTVTASGTGADSQQRVQDTDSCETDVRHPAIRIVKDGPATAHVGDTITYTFEVTNVGDTDLHDVTLSDPICDAGSVLLVDDGNGDAILAVDEVWRYSCTHVVTADDPDPLPNTATVSGTDEGGTTVTDEDSHVVDIIHPEIALEKDGPALAHVGDTITYTFTVTNPGDVDLFDVSLSDPICDPGTLVFTGGDTLGGDLRVGPHGAVGDGVLSPGEVWTYECTHVVTTEDPDPLPNTATVTAVDDQEDQVSDQASHLVDLIHPAIHIVKTADPTSGSPGDTITYTYVVTNTGDTTLFDVRVDDDVIGHIGDITELEAGPEHAVTLTATFTLSNRPVTNVGTAVGTDVLGLTVTDDDEALVQVVLPHVEKHPRSPRPTAFTGFRDRGLATIALGLLGLGLAAAVLGRRRRRLAA